MDGDVVSDIVGSYMTWITCILREIRVNNFSRCHLDLGVTTATAAHIRDSSTASSDGIDHIAIQQWLSSITVDVIM